MNRLSRIFNTKVIKERVSCLAKELIQQDRDHQFRNHEPSNLSNIDSLHRLLTDTNYTFAKAHKNNFSLRLACRYLQKTKTLTRSQCAIVTGMLGVKRGAEALKKMPIYKNLRY